MKRVTMMVMLGAAAAHADPIHNSAFLNTSYVNGKFLNGKYLNGKYLNTALVNGGIVAGESVSGMTRWGEPIAGVRLRASELVGTTDAYDPVARIWYPVPHDGDWFVGAIMHGTFVGVDNVLDVGDLRIDSFERLPQPNSDVTLYTVSAHFDGPQGGIWVPICGLDEQGAPIRVIPLQGTWSYESGAFTGGAKLSDSPDAVTFACLDGALGKCAAAGYPNTLGYKPWSGTWDYACEDDGWCGWSFHDHRDLHQTCTRMVRADYCGDGQTHTVTGTPIDVYDDAAIHVPEGPEPWRFEAAWQPDGASWISCYRVIPLDPGGCPLYPDPTVLNAQYQHEVTRMCPFVEDPPLVEGDLIGDRMLTPALPWIELAIPRSM